MGTNYVNIIEILSTLKTDIVGETMVHFGKYEIVENKRKKFYPNQRKGKVGRKRFQSLM